MRRKHPLFWNRREFIQAAGTATAAASASTSLMGAYLGAQGSLPVAGPSDWDRFAYDLHNTRFNVREANLNAGNVGRLRIKWSHEIGAPMQTSPTVVGDTVFVGAWDGHYHALDAQSGEPKWSYDAGVTPETKWQLRTMKSTAQYDRGRVYFGTGEGHLNCLDAATGREIWKTPMDPGERITSSPNIYGDRVFLGTSGPDAHVVCVDADTGAVRWKFLIVPDRKGGGGSAWTSPAVDEQQNIVYSVTGNPRSFAPPGPLLFADSIIANDLETGELLWHYQVRASDPFNMDFSCHPMIFEAVSPGKRGARRPCVGAGNKSAFFAWDRYTGELLWRTMLTPPTGLSWNSTAAAYNKIYVVSNNTERDPDTGQVTGRSESVTAALQAYTGEIVWWRHNTSGSSSPVCVANGVFYQSLRDGSLEAYDAETGKPLWQSTMPSTSRGGIVIANGNLYVSNGEAGLPTEPKHRYFVYAYSIDGR
jgi:alcohol dehydrogenase (cytochrome c)